MKGGAWKYYDYKKENSRYATKYIPNTGIDYPEKKNKHIFCFSFVASIGTD